MKSNFNILLQRLGLHLAIILSALVIFLAACGGGGSSGPTCAPLSQASEFSRVNFAGGAISLADFDNDSIYELLGTDSSANSCLTTVAESDIGLGDLRAPGRAYRDVRFADFNNDGFVDAIANVYTENPDEGYIQLYWGNFAGHFVIDPIFEAKKYQGFGETIVVADFDNDGFVDIFIPQYFTSDQIYSRNLLFKNNHNKTFDEVAVAAGVARGAVFAPEGAQAVDYDLDGWIDLYFAGSLFRNTGGFKFQDVTTAVGLPGVFEEGAKFFDQNNDGYLDLIIQYPNDGPSIYINNKNEKFIELSSTVFPVDYFYAAYGINVGDVNGDGNEDILIAGGLAEDGTYNAPRLWLFDNGRYVNHEFIEKGMGWSDLVSFGDLDNDGSLDIILRYGGNMILLNNKLPIKYVKIDVVSNGLRNQYGRVIKAKYANGEIKSMVVDGGSGYMSNQPYPVLFANNSNEVISFEIYCKDKIVTINATDGSHQVDCGSIL